MWLQVHDQTTNVIDYKFKATYASNITIEWYDYLIKNIMYNTARLRVPVELQLKLDYLWILSCKDFNCLI